MPNPGPNERLSELVTVAANALAARHVCETTDGCDPVACHCLAEAHVALSAAGVPELLRVVEAAWRLCDDEESGVGGFGPDITHIVPLRAALLASEDKT